MMCMSIPSENISLINYDEISQILFSVFSGQPMGMDIPDVGATDSPQYYADANPMIDVDGSDIPEDLQLR